MSTSSFFNNHFSKFKYQFLFLLLLFSLIPSIIPAPKKPSKPKQTIQGSSSPNNKGKPNPQQDKSKFRTAQEQKLKEFQKEYKKALENVTMQFSYQIPVPPRKDVIIYQNVTKVPTILKGAYVLSEEIDKILDFKILTPSGRVIYTSSKNYGIFTLKVNEKGLYQFTFNNKFVNAEIKPMFMLNSGQNSILEKESLTVTEKKMEEMILFLNKFDQETKINRGNRRQRQNQLAKTNKVFFIFSLVETVVLIGVAIWQYYYLRHLFEVKGSL